MNFISIHFVLFFLPVLCLGWMLINHRNTYRNLLIAAGLFFYGSAGTEYIALLLGVALITWAAGRLLGKFQGNGKRKLVTGLHVSVIVLTLALFKYYEPLLLQLGNFLGSEHAWMRQILNSEWANIMLPVGLSFFSFQAISYVVDHYRKPELPARRLLDVVAYISFFPTLLSGPIMRENEFFPQLQNRSLDDYPLCEGLTLILSGLFKKVVLATYLQQNLVDLVYQDPGGYSTATMWVTVFAYSIQIFCDFSGYTDLALGIGRLMGFRLPENFNAPYRALNLQEFWHRWHISLSTWLRDYVYISLGGNRKGNRYINLLLTMVIGGLWHGSGLPFLIWGTMHGLGLVIVHGWLRFKKRFLNFNMPDFPGNVFKIISWVMTFTVISLLWVFFRAESWEQALRVLEGLYNGQQGAGFSGSILFVIAIGLFLQFGGHLTYRYILDLQKHLPWFVQSAVAAVLAGFILNMGPEGMLPFIYFNF